MPVDVIPRTTSSSGSRLSSFGFSGTIAHGAFGANKVARSHNSTTKYPSLYRGCCVKIPIHSAQRSIWLVQRSYQIAESLQSLPDLAAVRAPARKVTDVAGIVKKTVEALTGAIVSGNEALMDVGIDSLSAVELVSTLGHELNTEIEPTVLFDHPTIGDLVNYLVAHIESSIDNRTMQHSSSQ